MARTLRHYYCTHPPPLAATITIIHPPPYQRLRQPLRQPTTTTTTTTTTSTFIYFVIQSHVHYRPPSLPLFSSRTHPLSPQATASLDAHRPSHKRSHLVRLAGPQCSQALPKVPRRYSDLRALGSEPQSPSYLLLHPLPPPCTGLLHCTDNAGDKLSSLALARANTPPLYMNSTVTVPPTPSPGTQRTANPVSPRQSRFIQGWPPRAHRSRPGSHSYSHGERGHL